MAGSGAVGGLLGREVLDARQRAWLFDHRDALLVAVGIVFRVARYLADRGYWLDEASLASNLIGRSLGRVLGPLDHMQLAPAGFLAVEWLAVQVFGPSSLALRLVPLLGGIAALIGFRALAGRALAPGAVTVAVALFAVSGDLIYYASELKPYSTDVAAAVACMLGALALESGSARPIRFALAGLGGAAVVWFSFPSAFVLAGAGSALFASALARRDRTRAMLLVVVGIVWLASIAGVHAVARRQLGDAGPMRGFWGMIFAPWPPRSLWDATWAVRRFLFLFVNPLDFRTPLGAEVSAIPALVLCGIGFATLARTHPIRGAVVALPGVLALAASAAWLYPFHGRLVLFLVPALLLLIASGAERVRRAVPSRPLRVAVLASLFLFPTLDAVVQLIEGPASRDFHRLGDLRPSSLDPEWFPFQSKPE